MVRDPLVTVTVTSNVEKAVAGGTALSRTAHVSRVVPTGNIAPLGGEQVTAEYGGVPPEATGTGNVTAVGVPSGVVTVRLATEPRVSAVGELAMSMNAMFMPPVSNSRVICCRPAAIVAVVDTVVH